METRPAVKGTRTSANAVKGDTPRSMVDFAKTSGQPNKTGTKNKNVKLK